MYENHNIPLCRSVFRLNKELVQSIQSQTYDEGFRIQTATERLAKHIAQTKTPELILADKFISPQAGARWSPANIGNQSPDEAAYSHYVQFLRNHSWAAVRNSVPLPRALGLTLERCAEIQKKHGAVPVVDSKLEGRDVLLVAWNRARSLRVRMQRALATTAYLAEQARRRDTEDCGEVADVIGGRLMRFFYQQGHLAEADELKLAILLGGEALELTREKIAVSALDEKFSAISQHLAHPRAMPRSFDQDSERSFCNRLKEYHRR